MQTPPPYNPYDPYNSRPTRSEARVEAIASGSMKSVYLKMTFAMLVTAFTCLFCANSPAYMQFLATNRWFMWVLLGAELLFVFGVSGGLTRFSTTAISLMFYAFAVVNGMWLSPLLLIYTQTSLAKTFFITAATFGAMTVYGYFTTRDLTRWGNFFFMALIGLLIAMVVNIFARSTTLEWIISGVGVLLFVGLTAWDTQYIKRLAAVMPADMQGKIATYGAMNLYLDFINLFLFLLRFFGASRD